ncbi:OPT/YSL family transporter, partial [Klebsiella pneumoniae]|nr:OPT/YSL family transporter [Klebsiella pneumoniae]
WSPKVLVFVFGEAWALATPRHDRFKWKWLQATLRFLNSGQPFGIKEHVVAALIASSGNNGLSGVEIYAVERLFYNKSV